LVRREAGRGEKGGTGRTAELSKETKEKAGFKGDKRGKRPWESRREREAE